MKTSEDKIRELALEALSVLGSDATEDKVKSYVESKLSSEGIAPGSEQKGGTRAILTTFGINQPGVVATITAALSESGCDILDISQKIMQEFYTMIMMIDISNSSADLRDIQDRMNRIAEQLKIKIFLQHEDVFRYMHRI